MAPILQRTLANYLKNGAAKAFSGPLQRGDVATIAEHLRALERMPQAGAVYRALVNAAVSHLPVKRRSELKPMLDFRPRS
jgi:predicted short-subunit dehydrogenase-like oxidoreductase (DUF2520 family)